MYGNYSRSIENRCYIGTATTSGILTIDLYVENNSWNESYYGVELFSYDDFDDEIYFPYYRYCPYYEVPVMRGLHGTINTVPLYIPQATFHYMYQIT